MYISSLHTECPNISKIYFSRSRKSYDTILSRSHTCIGQTCRIYGVSALRVNEEDVGTVLSFAHMQIYPEHLHAASSVHVLMNFKMCAYEFAWVQACVYVELMRSARIVRAPAPWIIQWDDLPILGQQSKPMMTSRVVPRRFNSFSADIIILFFPWLLQSDQWLCR